ncbi:MAG: hypothetical protein ACHQQR_00750 [Gemmatimonadales bacterium]
MSEPTRDRRGEGQGRHTEWTMDFGKKSPKEIERAILLRRDHDFALRKVGGTGAFDDVLAVAGWPNADFSLQPTAGDTSLVGALMQLFAVNGEVKTLEVSQAIVAGNQAQRATVYGRGCTRWEARIVMPAGTVSAQRVRLALTSFEGGASTSSSAGPPGGGVPLWYNGPLSAVGANFQASGVVKASPGNLLEFFGTNAGPNTRWIQVFDAAAVPANGATPVLRAEVPAGAYFSFSLTDPQDAAPGGRPFAAGISWAVSITGPQLTIDVGAAFDINAKFV